MKKFVLPLLAALALLVGAVGAAAKPTPYVNYGGGGGGAPPYPCDSFSNNTYVYYPGPPYLWYCGVTSYYNGQYTYGWSPRF